MFEQRYKIVRMSLRGRARVIKRGLTLKEAQEWCKNPETSGRTCSDLKKRGDWFDGYEKE